MTRQSTRTFGTALLLLTAFFLGSCSKIKLGYGLADWYISAEAHRYLKLDAAGEKRLQEDIKAYLRWHRVEMLPVYASAFRKLAAAIREPGKDPDGLRLAPSMLDGIYASSVEPMLGPTAELLAGLDEAGIRYLKKGMTERLEKQKKKYLADEKLSKKRRQIQVARTLKDFTGKLSDPQLAQIAKLNRDLKMPVEAWLEDSERRQRELLEALAQKPSPRKIEALLRDWWLRPHTKAAKKDPTRMDPAEIQAYWQGILEILTPEQRLRTAERLEQYAADFEELARDPAPAPRPGVVN